MSILKSMLSKVLTVVIATFMVVGCALMLVPKMNELRGLTRKRDQQLENIASLQEQVRRLQDKQQRFRTDPEFVAQVARENRRLRPDEWVFVFEGEQDR